MSQEDHNTSGADELLNDAETERHCVGVSHQPQKRFRRDPPRGYELSYKVERRRPERDLCNHRDKWKCVECHEWNHVDVVRCMRCRAPGPAGPYQGNTSSDRCQPNIYSHGNDERELQLDEFGRMPNKMSSRKKSHEWPPRFEENGSAFVFDSRSGMFYEALSDFFYDPQTKLYYGNKKNAYFSYDESQRPPFVRVQTMNGQTSQSENPDSVDCPDAKAKKTISINLKTKSFAKPKAKMPNQMKPHDVASTSVDRKVASDLQKWTERQEETLKIVRKGHDNIQKTPKGEPICELCRRKFQSLEQLRRHENLSNLHKENLLKAQKRKNPAEEPESSYIDRAEHRRRMYGHDQQDPARKVSMPVDSSTQEVVPVKSLGDANVGKQMLHRLGWKEGQYLGNRTENASEVMQCLESDWEKIESVARVHSRGDGERRGA